MAPRRAAAEGAAMGHLGGAGDLQPWGSGKGSRATQGAEQPWALGPHPGLWASGSWKTSSLGVDRVEDQESGHG